MWSSMNRLFSGGSDAVHMSMSIVAPAMQAGFIAMPSSSATPIASRPDHEQHVDDAGARDALVDRRERAGRVGEEPLGGVAAADPRVGRGRLVAEAERLVQERPQEGPAQAEPGRCPEVAHERPVGPAGWAVTVGPEGRGAVVVAPPFTARAGRGGVCVAGVMVPSFGWSAGCMANLSRERSAASAVIPARAVVRRRGARSRPDGPSTAPAYRRSRHHPSKGTS